MAGGGSPLGSSAAAAATRNVLALRAEDLQKRLDGGAAALAAAAAAVARQARRLRDCLQRVGTAQVAAAAAADAAADAAAAAASAAKDSPGRAGRRRASDTSPSPARGVGQEFPPPVPFYEPSATFQPGAADGAEELSVHVKVGGSSLEARQAAASELASAARVLEFESFGSSSDDEGGGSGKVDRSGGPGLSSSLVSPEPSRAEAGASFRYVTLPKLAGLREGAGVGSGRSAGGSSPAPASSPSSEASLAAGAASSAGLPRWKAASVPERVRARAILDGASPPPPRTGPLVQGGAVYSSTASSPSPFLGSPPRRAPAGSIFFSPVSPQRAAPSGMGGSGTSSSDATPMAARGGAGSDGPGGDSRRSRSVLGHHYVAPVLSGPPVRRPKSASSSARPAQAAPLPAASAVGSLPRLRV